MMLYLFLWFLTPCPLLTTSCWLTLISTLKMSASPLYSWTWPQSPDPPPGSGFRVSYLPRMVAQTPFLHEVMLSTHSWDPLHSCRESIHTHMAQNPINEQAMTSPKKTNLYWKIFMWIYVVEYKSNNIFNKKQVSNFWCFYLFLQKYLI